MIDELNLSPMGYLVFFAGAIVLLIVAIRRESYFTLESEPLDPKENTRYNSTSPLWRCYAN